MKDFVALILLLIPSSFVRAKDMARTGEAAGAGSCFTGGLLHTERRQAPLDKSSPLGSATALGIVENSAIY